MAGPCGRCSIANRAITLPNGNRRHLELGGAGLSYRVQTCGPGQRFKIGMSPPPPHVCATPLAVLELMMYHVPVEGRKTAMSLRPSPS